nr:MAG TPA: hypothetical protein [Caudoviricetes sp.]
MACYFTYIDNKIIHVIPEFPRKLLILYRKIVHIGVFITPA